MANVTEEFESLYSQAQNLQKQNKTNEYENVLSQILQRSSNFTPRSI